MEHITIPFAILLFAVEFAAYLVKGVAGFGDPLITNPCLSMTAMTNSQITPLILLGNWPANLYISIKNRKAFSARQCLPMIACIVLGIIPGVYCLKFGQSNILKLGLGIVIIVCGVEMLTRKPSATAKGNVVVMVLVSIASGFFSALYGIGIFFVAYIERTGYVNRNQFRGQMCFIFLIDNTIRLLLYLYTGIYTLLILKMAVIGNLGAICGLYVGNRIDKRLSEHAVHRFITIVFIIAGVSTLIKAVLAMI